MYKFQITYRNNYGNTDTVTVTSSTPITESQVISQFIARTGYRVIACNRTF